MEYNRGALDLVENRWDRWLLSKRQPSFFFINHASSSHCPCFCDTIAKDFAQLRKFVEIEDSKMIALQSLFLSLSEFTNPIRRTISIDISLP